MVPHPCLSTAQALHSQPGGAQSPLCSCRLRTTAGGLCSVNSVTTTCFGITAAAISNPHFCLCLCLASSASPQSLPDHSYPIARFCTFVIATSFWLAVLPLRLLVGSPAGLTWPAKSIASTGSALVRAAIARKPHCSVSLGPSLDSPIGSSTPQFPRSLSLLDPFLCMHLIFFSLLFFSPAAYRDAY